MCVLLILVKNWWLMKKSCDSVKVIDLFSGVGGLSLGFKQEGFEIVLANEIDEEIAESYRLNHPETKMINEDITKLDIPSVFGEYQGKIDVVLGGPPCQGFSQKGSRRTIDDERNYLFRYFCEVIRYVQPQYFVMENVPRILTAEKGFFRKEILGIFKELGYSVSCAVFNASSFGVPQDRCRAIFIGKKGSDACPLPQVSRKKTTIWDAISDLAYLESGEGSECQQYATEPASEYQKAMREGSNVLYNHVATRHSPDAIKKMELVPPGHDKDVLPKEMLTKSIYSGTWSRMKPDDQSVTITTRFDTPSSGRFMHPYLNRCITPREAARIQSFPDSFIFYGSKSSQMKQIGNAVPPLMSRAIAKAILKDASKK